MDTTDTIALPCGQG